MQQERKRIERLRTGMMTVAAIYVWTKKLKRPVPTSINALEVLTWKMEQVLDFQS